MIEYSVNTHGAELQSLQKGGHEYLWQGDPAYWGRRAPILFPIVGQVAGGVFRVNGTAYKMGQHGFARDTEFTACGEGAFCMEAVERENYPYRPALSSLYIAGEDSLACRWTVRNEGVRPMHFQIGAHPAFNLPDYAEADAVHGYFQCLDAAGRPVNPVIRNSVNGGLRHAYVAPKTLDSVIPIDAAAFADDAILIEDSQVASVVLMDKSRRPVLRVDCPGAQAFGLWAPAKPGCPFVCIEPWCGIADMVGFDGDIAARELDHCLAPGEEFVFEYKLVLL